MSTKWKQLTSQEWVILSLFIVSILFLVVTVHWSAADDDRFSNNTNIEENSIIAYNDIQNMEASSDKTPAGEEED
ncbi:hypothetical protein [Bacillus piscicola]|uniref:hypothetical protein n=1 Tax=Bacillus piscicola TaxID=1632684 RepID=UPI001F098F87|nr:hypothetical protein [Bacillus piscicola]